MKTSITIRVFFLAFLCAQFTWGQGFETPVITQKVEVAPQKKSNSSRFQKKAPLALPFWDDFSQSRVYPDTSRWENSYDVAISPTTAIDAMSLNTAVFNGIKVDGTAHSNVDFQEGDTDILTSRIIDLSTHDENDGIYLSFFYEKKGNGEVPNSNDGIRVEFMNEDSVWVSNIWNITGDEVVEIDSFYQVLLPVNELQYFSDKFRFRFVATGRQTGLFDTWLVDYVYLNEGRNSNDTEYPDRTFTKPLSSTFKNYHSIPVDHFLLNPMSNLDFVGSQFTLLGTDNEVFIYELYVEIAYVNDLEDTIILAPRQQLATPDDNTDDFNGLDNVFEHRDFEAGNIVDVTGLPTDPIYAELRYELIGDLGDNISPTHGNIDFRINDSIRNTFILDNYYAYDDGTAERGAGVNNSDSQLAYRFDMNPENIDEISAIDIYFPNTVQDVQFGKMLTLKVWDNNQRSPSNELFSKEILIQKVDTLNQFYRYELEQTVSVSDTFYIGWQQETSDRIFVGLDKNTDSSDRIYFNITGDWEQNIDDITGSLMLRPVFGEVETPNVVAGIDQDTFNSSIKLYPNPTSGMVQIEGDYDHLEVLTLNGKRLQTGIIKDRIHTEVNMYGFPSGIYIIRLRKDHQVITRKIILNQ